jgi:hypothetical protein
MLTVATILLKIRIAGNYNIVRKRSCEADYFLAAFIAADRGCVAAGGT